MRLALLTNDCLLVGAGGVQVCTNEFLDLFRAIDPALTLVTYATDQGLPARLRRRLFPSPYHRLIDRSQLRRCLRHLREAGTTMLLLNNADALALAPLLRRAMPGLRLVYLSHGPVVTDVVNGWRLPLPGEGPRRPFEATPGRVLDDDLRLRRHIDGTVSISASDDAMEAWLGSPVHCWIPRPLGPRPLDLKPLPGRIGCVSTLNHAPNHDGLVQLAQALDARPGVQLRLVGGPEGLGRRLAHRHPSITYLGRLSDADLAAEMVGWRGVVNPIFCPARGCSMKVKTALEQGLPVLTTPTGARGYRWDPQALPLGATPAALADLVRRVALEDDAHREALAGVARILSLAESRQALVARLEGFLQALPPTLS
jgi:Glycosyl transferases group 1